MYALLVIVGATRIWTSITEDTISREPKLIDFVKVYLTKKKGGMVVEESDSQSNINHKGAKNDKVNSFAIP